MTSSNPEPYNLQDADVTKRLPELTTKEKP